MSAEDPVACSQSEASTSRITSSDTYPEALTAGLPGLAELTARVTALEKIAQIEERITRLESYKRTSEAIDNLISQLVPQDQPFLGTSSGHQASPIWPSVEEDTSDSSGITNYRPYKRAYYSRGIKITPSYTLQVSSSLRE